MADAEIFENSKNLNTKIDLHTFLSTTYTLLVDFAFYWLTSRSTGSLHVLLVHFVLTYSSNFQHDWPGSDREDNTLSSYYHLIVFVFSRVGVFAFLLASAEIMYTSHRLCVIYLLPSYICVFGSCCVRVDFVWYGWLPSKFTYCPRSEHEVEFSHFAYSLVGFVLCVRLALASKSDVL